MTKRGLKKFPDNFLWGVSSAAYQIEGAYRSDGKGLSVWDEFSHIPGKTFKNTNGDVAVDHYNRYEEDIKLMRELGIKTYRLSISWSRILPKGKGEVNENGLLFYEKIIDELIKNNIEPMITIYHWDLPLELQKEYGGFENRLIIEDYVNYAKILFLRFGSKVKYWLTFNEQNIFTLSGWVNGKHPPGKSYEIDTFVNVNHHINLAHAKTVLLFKELNLKGKIGVSFAYSPIYPKNSDPINNLASEVSEEVRNNYWLDIYGFGRYSQIAINYFKKLGASCHFPKEDLELIKKSSNKIDYLGINYYQSSTVKQDENEIKDVKFENINNPYLERTDWDWEIDAVGLRLACNQINSRYNLPILITENGLGAVDVLENNQIDDKYRIDYIHKHVEQIHYAIKDGCQILGYCVWSFTDLLSWLNGYSKRYGLVYVARDEIGGTLNRYPKKSYYWYKKVIEQNGVDSDE